MKIRSVDFDFDILRASDAERFEQAARQMQDTAARVPRDSLVGSIRATCAMIDSFLADVLGDDYDQRLGLDVENLREMQAVYTEVLAAVTEVQKEIEAFGAVNTVAKVDAKARAAAAARNAAASLPGPVYAAEAKPSGAVAEAAPGPVAFPTAAARPTPQPPLAYSQMNRAQRREYVKKLKGGK